MNSGTKFYLFMLLLKSQVAYLHLHFKALCICLRQRLVQPTNSWDGKTSFSTYHQCLLITAIFRVLFPLHPPSLPPHTMIFLLLSLCNSFCYIFISVTHTHTQTHSLIPCIQISKGNVATESKISLFLSFTIPPHSLQLFPDSILYKQPPAWPLVPLTAKVPVLPSPNFAIFPQVYSSNLKTMLTGSSKMMLPIYRTTQHHIPKHCNPYITDNNENLRSLDSTLFTAYVMPPKVRVLNSTISYSKRHCRLCDFDSPNLIVQVSTI